LRSELLRRAKDRGLEYAIVIRRVGGGSASSFVEMARQMATQQSGSEVLPEAVKLSPDGQRGTVRGSTPPELEAGAVWRSVGKEMGDTGDNQVVYSDEIIPRMASVFSMGVGAGSNLPVVSCVIPSLLFEEISLTKSEGPFPAPPVSTSPLAEK